jgi:metal-responsive CopG/Arc/MetJ family transcriptional regulator
MPRFKPSSRKRINITLPGETLNLLDRLAKQGERSALIAEAVTVYLSERRRKTLRRRLMEGAIARAERDRLLAEEWLLLEEAVRERKKIRTRHL